MSLVFQNIDPPTPPPPRECGAGGGHTRWVEKGVWVLIVEDARHSSVLCKYSVGPSIKSVSVLNLKSFASS